MIIFAGVEAVTNEKDAFHDIDYAFLVGAMPRKEGMERKVGETEPKP